MSQLFDPVLSAQGSSMIPVFFEINQTGWQVRSEVFGAFSGVVRFEAAFEVYRITRIKSAIPAAEDIDEMSLGLFL